MRIPHLDREAHVEMVIMLICACSDCSDFFNYVNAPHVKDHLGLVVLILTVFTISTFQFSVTLTRHKPMPCKYNRAQTFTARLFEVVFCTKIWSILFLLFTQDLPYFIVRVALLCTTDLNLDRTIYLFLIKNLLLIYFDVYQVFYIYVEYKDRGRRFENAVEMGQFVVKTEASKC
jgi:hypothetical protein